VRQALFNVLGQWCEGLRVLDLYAGTGALGLEAVSRGAAKATLVDSGKEALGLCRQNIDALKLGDRVELVASPMEKVWPRFAGQSFDLIFADPPYALHAGQAVLEAALQHRLLADGARVIIEHEQGEVLTAPAPLELFDQRAYGDTRVSIFRLTGPAP
jgi:16S rRNA (guanine(966)-N(2))-methyltransferase RsmD